MGASLEEIRTPALILDRGVLSRNAREMAERMSRHGVRLRPHVKTAKSVDVARIASAGAFGGITVSTLAEAEHFAAGGFTDQTYAVAIVPSKLDAVSRIQDRGATVRILTDDGDVAREIAATAERRRATFRVLVEVDTGGRRSGVSPDGPELLEVARILDAAPGIELEGVLTHAGHAYRCSSVDEIRRVAEEEREGVVRAAERLRAAGIPCPVVSAGSTPTAVHADRLDGVTEMRPGNYVFFDLFQACIGSCSEADIAVTVLASVIGRVRGEGRILVDAGSLALSADTSAAARRAGIGYGRVLDLEGRERWKGLHVCAVNQEHGFVEDPSGRALEQLTPGSRVRILPNHSCITAAMHERYEVVDGGRSVVAVWSRIRGW